jgi:hypothetical protein
MTRATLSSPDKPAQDPLMFAGFMAILCLALVTGIFRNPPGQRDDVPRIGSIQVLNGCGIAGAGDNMADFLREKKFDVKNISNAPSFNYPFTMVISRSQDMGIARQVAAALRTEHIVMVRTEDRTYDATVIAGPDFKGWPQ